MRDPSHLPYLVRLLEDDSPFVQEAVLKELASFGPELEDEMRRGGIHLDARARQRIRDYHEEASRSRLRECWGSWSGVEGEEEKMEAALSLLADFESASWDQAALSARLDTLARECRESHLDADPFQLAQFLFRLKHFQGVQTDYYHPDHSNLVAVIERRRGLPISLALIYMLVGHRLGLAIEGCNFPGHFLARFSWQGKTILVDCFNGGVFLGEEDVAQPSRQGRQVQAAGRGLIKPARLGAEALPGIRAVLREKADARTVIARVLKNLAQAYELGDRAKDKELMTELLEALEQNAL
jgi:regulator of sirC expression with transglutaminase-like and TPR domain